MYLFWSLLMAAGEGFEPSHTESESAVLPLHNPAILHCSQRCVVQRTNVIIAGTLHLSTGKFLKNQNLENSCLFPTFPSHPPCWWATWWKPPCAGCGKTSKPFSNRHAKHINLTFQTFFLSLPDCIVGEPQPNARLGLLTIFSGKFLEISGGIQ